jgi:dihydroorotase
MRELLLKGGTVLSENGPSVADVHVAGDTVVAVGPDLAVTDAEILDCSDTWIGPGLVDLHTHLREPGEEWKEDVASGSRAAAAGGFTALVAMPNTDPPIDAGHLARFVVERGRVAGLVDVQPAGCITMGRAGEKLAHLDELRAAGVTVFSDDGDAVADAGLARRAMEYLAEIDGVYAEHCEDAGLVRGGHMHEGEVSARLGMTGRPVSAEEIILARDLTLVAETGVRFHALHVSSSVAVGLVAAAKAAGLPVTAEVTPHHLAFDHEAVVGTDPAFKMHPPLRAPADRAALVTALQDGVIDVVATDHAPHAAHEKDVPFEHAPAGVIGLETALAVAISYAGLDQEALFDRMSTAPAAIAGLERHGGPIAAGVAANLVAIDPEDRWVAGPGESRAVNSPFHGLELRGRARFTMHDGRITWGDGKVQG